MGAELPPADVCNWSDAKALKCYLPMYRSVNSLYVMYSLELWLWKSGSSKLVMKHNQYMSIAMSMCVFNFTPVTDSR